MEKCKNYDALEKISKEEMKQFYGGDDPKRVVIVIDGVVYIIWV
jgi:hypothetical protein